MNSANTRMNTSAIRNSSTFLRNARRMSGRAWANWCPSKKDARTAGHPVEWMTAITSTVKKTTVERTAMTTLRRPSPCHAPPRIRERRPGGGTPSGRCCGTSGAVSPPITLPAPARLPLDHRERDVLQVLLLERVQCPVGAKGGDGAVHAAHQGIALLEDDAEELLLADRGELSHHDPVLRLSDQHVHVRVRRVDEVTVDLSGVEGGDHVGGVVVDRWVLVRLDVVHDVGVARRPDLHAELLVLQVGKGLRVRGRRPRVRH